MDRKPISASQFSRRFNRLILTCWTVPAIFGLSYLVAIQIFTPQQIFRILITPLEPIFILANILFAYFFFKRYSRPWLEFLSHPDAGQTELVIQRIRRFPLAFWTVFLIYLILAPSSVMVAAEIYSDYQASPVDWFRIHLVALIVSIIVGLPIFFRIFDLLGRALGRIETARPILTVKTKVFLIGSLIPLLIDTMLVQYYWTRTGYFGIETLLIWFVLELLAIFGSIMFVRSFGQSLMPLRDFIASESLLGFEDFRGLVPQSTDELGVLTTRFRELLELRRKIEQDETLALRQVKAMYENLPVGIAYLDHDFRFVNINRFFREFTGFSEETIVGRQCSMVFRKNAENQAGKDMYDLFSTLTEKGCTKAKEPLVIEHPFGDHIVKVVSAPEFDRDGKIVGCLVVMEDITDRKRLEEQLLHAQKMEALGTLTGGIAHEYNNIMTSILGYAELLQGELGEGSSLMKYTDIITASAERAARLTDGLLAYSRKRPTKMEIVEVNEVIEGTEKYLPNIVGEGIRVDIDLSEEELTVLADRAQIEHILMNLVTNALDAMPAGGTLTINSRSVDFAEETVEGQACIPSGRYALITVKDTGHGIEQNKLEKIFEPFYTTKEVGKGTGLGLAMVYGIVRRHDGYISVDSEPEKYTRFNVYFPLKAPESKEETAAVTPQVTPEVRLTATVLVAEDDEGVRNLVKQSLRQVGFEVIEAVDGEDAIAKFLQYRDEIDLLLFDVVMPKKNGYEAYEEICKLAPEAKVLFLSGYVPDDERIKKITDAGNILLQKPISPQKLIGTIQEVLKKD